MRPLPFVLASTDHGTLIVNRLDFNTIPEGIYGVGHQLLNNASYEMNEIELVKKILRARRADHGDGVVAIDCGANIGVHTVEMAREMLGWGSVIAVEAQERIYYALCGNIAISNLFNVSALNATLVADQKQEFIQIPVLNYSKPGSFGSLELARRPGTEYIGQSVSYATKDLVFCNATTVDKIVYEKRNPRLDFLKIDVEGMELSVLQGAQESITQLRPSMLIEAIKVDQQALNEFLDQNHYTKTSQGMNWIALPNELNQRSI